jgi:hypothetical protein
MVSAWRFRHRGDDVPDALVAIHDKFVIGMATGVVLKLQEVGNITEVHLNSA